MTRPESEALATLATRLTNTRLTVQQILDYGIESQTHWTLPMTEGLFTAT